MKQKRQDNTSKLLIFAVFWLLFPGNGISQSVTIILPASPNPGNPNEWCKGDEITLNSKTEDISSIDYYIWLVSESGEAGSFLDTLDAEKNDSIELSTEETGSKWYRLDVIYGSLSKPKTARSDSIEILINALPSSTISADTEICKGNTAEITTIFEGAGPWDFQINGEEHSFAGTSYDTLVGPEITTTYKVTQLKDANGCLAPDTSMQGEAVITVFDLPTFSISAVDKICAGNTDSIFIHFLTGESPWTLAYESEQDQEIDLLVQQADTALAIEPNEYTTYDFTLFEDGNGCSPSDTGKNKQLTIEVQEPPHAGIGATIKICAGDTAIVLDDDTVYISEGELTKNLFPFLGGVPDTEGNWDPFSINLNLGKTFTYKVDAIDPCTEDDTAQILIIEEPKEEALPVVGKPYDHPVLLIYPENELEYRWYREGEEFVLDTGQYYLFERPGNYYVKVNIPGSYCITESEMFTVFPLSDTAVAKAYASAFDLFPNPANDHVTLILKEQPVSNVDNLKVKIVSVTGSCVFESSISEVMEDINIQRLHPGVYTIFIVSDDRIYGTHKLLISR